MLTYSTKFALSLSPSPCYFPVIVIYVATLCCCRVRRSCSLIAPFAANVVKTHTHTLTLAPQPRPEVNDFLPGTLSG